MRVTQMTSPKSGNPVANQFRIETDDAIYFQSYRTIIAKYDKRQFKMYLDEDAWNYSRTTSKYRNQFLNETTDDTKRKIREGVYQLTDLN